MTMTIMAGGVVRGFAAPVHRFDVPDGATR
jgi:hypothetical protein